MISNPRKAILLAMVILVIANLALFWKFYFQGLLPFPGDLLVSFYFPWNSGGFAGFDPWTTRKDVIAMDVVRQIYPWKTLAFDLIKQGQLPLWNPYNFSGTPLLANLQSSIFFPGSLLFLILPYLWAWVGLVVSLPFIFSVFSYLFLRSLKLTIPAAIFGAVAISNISYITVWAEQLVVIQSALFLPLLLWSVNKYKDKQKIYFLLLAAVLLAFSVFGGHLQTSVYVYLVTIAYLIFKRIDSRLIATVLLLSLGLSGVQLIPSLELYWHSAREVEASRQLFFQSTLPWQNLVTVLAPDFFGNPATGNFRGRDYGNFTGYFGIVALVLGLFSLFNLPKIREIRLFGLLGLVGLIFSLSPFAHVFEFLRLPVLSSGYPSRFIFLFQFSLAVLSAYGLNFWLKEKTFTRRTVILVFMLAIIYVAGWILTLVNKSPEWLVTRNNLILPTTIFLTISALLLVPKAFKSRYLYVLSTVFLLLAIAEYSYFFNKYQPFAPAKFVFPNHPVFSFLRDRGAIDRFYGVDSAYVDNNFASYFRVFTPEGYDPLYIKRYGELLWSTEDGRISGAIPRSDAFFTKKETIYRHKVFDLLGVKYILDKTDIPLSNWEPDIVKFPLDRHELFWQNFKWKAYSRKTALPRVFLVDKYEVTRSQEEIISRIYAPDFGPRETIVLERDPGRKFSPEAGGEVTVDTYSPNKIVLKTYSQGAKLLFISDNYYPGWKAFVDGKERLIYRANYTFRAVPLEGGKHTVVFSYEPVSFRLGLILSIISVGFILVVIKLRNENL